jgi:hypothetical protein
VDRVAGLEGAFRRRPGPRPRAGPQRPSLRGRPARCAMHSRKCSISVISGSAEGIRGADDVAGPVRQLDTPRTTRGPCTFDALVVDLHLLDVLGVVVHQHLALHRRSPCAAAWTAPATRPPGSRRRRSGTDTWMNATSGMPFCTQSRPNAEMHHRRLAQPEEQASRSRGAPGPRSPTRRAGAGPGSPASSR